MISVWNKWDSWIELQYDWSTICGHAEIENRKRNLTAFSITCNPPNINNFTHFQTCYLCTSSIFLKWDLIRSLTRRILKCCLKELFRDPYHFYYISISSPYRKSTYQFDGNSISEHGWNSTVIRNKMRKRFAITRSAGCSKIYLD